MQLPVQDMDKRFQLTVIQYSEDESTLKECDQAASRLTMNSIGSSISREDSHKACLEAKDYEGCIRVKEKGVSTASENGDSSKEYCEESGWCIAKAGRDRFNLIKKTGWMYKEFDDGDILYVNPTIKRIPHSSSSSRYLGQEQVFRYYSEPRVGSSSTTTTIGSAQTRCTGYDSYISCTTTPPAQITMPGTKRSAGGNRSIYRVLVVDCKDKTQALYVNGRVLGKWKKANLYGDIYRQCSRASEAPPLYMSL